MQPRLIEFEFTAPGQKFGRLTVRKYWWSEPVVRDVFYHGIFWFYLDDGYRVDPHGRMGEVVAAAAARREIVDMVAKRLDEANKPKASPVQHEIDALKYEFYRQQSMHSHQNAVLQNAVVAPSVYGKVY
jgi:hypothetical protein